MHYEFSANYKCQLFVVLVKLYRAISAFRTHRRNYALCIITQEVAYLRGALTVPRDPFADVHRALLNDLTDLNSQKLDATYVIPLDFLLQLLLKTSRTIAISLVRAQKTSN